MPVLTRLLHNLNSPSFSRESKAPDSQILSSHTWEAPRNTHRGGWSCCTGKYHPCCVLPWLLEQSMPGLYIGLSAHRFSCPTSKLSYTGLDWLSSTLAQGSNRLGLCSTFKNGGNTKAFTSKSSSGWRKSHHWGQREEIGHEGWCKNSWP